MGRVKELYMDIQMATWEVLEQNPTESFGNLVGQVASATRQTPEFVTSMVRDIYDEYREHGFNGDDRGGEAWNAE